MFVNHIKFFDFRKGNNAAEVIRNIHVYCGKPSFNKINSQIYFGRFAKGEMSLQESRSC